MAIDLNNFDELEFLINNKEDDIQKHLNGIEKNKEINSNRYTSDKNCSLFDFIKMVQKLVTLSLKEYSIDFSSDRLKYKITDPQIHLDNPVITYNTISRKPLKEIKPRIRDTVMNQELNVIGDIYAQKFDCIVQFNIFANTYDVAEEIMSEFEKMMIQYAGYFKRQGVGELLFEEELDDEKYDLFRQIISVRNIRYRVHVENMYPCLNEIIEDIIAD